MVAIAFAIAAPTLLGTSAAGIGASIAIGLLASYVDQNLTYPMLFGKPEGPKPTALEGFQLSTTDPGAPRWEVFGTRAWVPCHYLWTRGIREEISGNGQTGKGGRPFVQTLRADVGIAVCDGPISRTDILYSDERAFWCQEFDRTVLEEHRWAITAGTGGSAGRLIITATDSDVPDFSTLFAVGILVTLEVVSPAALQGYYRVAFIAKHSGTVMTRIELTPLRSQTPAAGVAGSAFEPARLRRIDHGCASSMWTVASGAPIITTTRPVGTTTIPGSSGDEQDLRKVWVVNGVYRFEGFTPAAVPGNQGANGLWKLDSRNGTVDPTSYYLLWRPLEGQSGTITNAGSPTVPGVIRRVGGTGFGAGFVFQDDPLAASPQTARQYPGFYDQLRDPTLAVHEPNPPAFRGLAYFSLAAWNMGPHNNMFPRVTALVRARSGETVNSAVSRICAKVMPPNSFDVGPLRPKTLLGYSIPGGTPRGQALQPILTYYGVAVQDRGGVLTFLDERDLPVVPVATRHLNARPVGEVSGERGFIAERVDKDDLPERVLVHYIDATRDGADGEEGDGQRAPGSPDRGGRDTLDVNLKPLVAWPWDVKRRSRELKRRILMETHRGAVTLPPGYMDVLPAHCLTFTSNNDEDEILPLGTTISFTTRLRDIVPESVHLEVLFVTAGRARLRDNGLGVFEGFPAGVTASVNSINYSTGAIALTCSQNFDNEHAPLIAYQYAKQWFMRASKATLRGYDFGVSCELVTATTDNPLPPVPRSLSTGLGAPYASVVPRYRVQVLDIPAIYPGLLRTVQIGFVVAPEPGASWRGAIVYQSPSGVDRWTAIGSIQAQSPIGATVGAALPAASTAVVDWENELTVDLPLGELLTGATLEQVANGINWALYGDEVIAFLEAEPGSGTEWILRGLVRGMRFTERAMDTHTGAGERFVMLWGLGWMHGMLHEPIGGFAAANRTYYFRVVPGGASITDVSTITTLVSGNSARPAAPILEADDKIDTATGIKLQWWRRSIDETTLFGPTPMPAGDFEEYRVCAIDHTQYTTLLATLTEDQAIMASTRRRWIVGGHAMGVTTLGQRTIAYSDADMTADLAVAGGSTIGLLVYQVGAGGHSPRSDILTHVP